LRKLFSIFLLIVFVFNIVGYKVAFYFMEQRAEHQIEQKLDVVKNSDKGLITIKVPLNLPYQTNWTDFERVDGEYNYNGKTYKYVKRKVLNDTLILVCLDFKEKRQIQKQSNDLFKKINDLTTNTTKKSVSKQNKTDDYYQPIKISLRALHIYQVTQVWHHNITPSFAGYLSSVFIPPDRVSA